MTEQVIINKEPTENLNSPIYTLQLNSRNSNSSVSSSTNAYNVTYSVSLASFLPLGYSKFKCNVVLKSELSSAGQVPIDTGMIQIDFANSLITNGSSLVRKIGFVYPVSYYTGSAYYGYYNTTTQDNIPFTLLYPYSCQSITVTMLSYNGTALGSSLPNGFPHYCLMISFEPII